MWCCHHQLLQLPQWPHISSRHKKECCHTIPPLLLMKQGPQTEENHKSCPQIPHLIDYTKPCLQLLWGKQETVQVYYTDVSNSLPSSGRRKDQHQTQLQFSHMLTLYFRVVLRGFLFKTSSQFVFVWREVCCTLLRIYLCERHYHHPFAAPHEDI